MGRPDLAVNRYPLPQLQRATLPLLRKQVRDDVRSCRDCPLHGVGSGPIPFHGPAPSGVVVLGEAPGKQEDEQGRPFVGPSGQLVRDLMRDVGLDPESVAWTNTVRCYPNRTPTANEVSACGKNTVAEFDLLQPYFVLVLGGVAVSAFHQIRIGEIRGRWWRIRYADVWAWALATWHPAAALRNESLVGEMKRDLTLFRMVVDAKVGIPEQSTCVKCGVETTYRKDDIAWCVRHNPNAVAKGMGSGRGKGRQTKQTPKDASGSLVNTDQGKL